MFSCKKCETHLWHVDRDIFLKDTSSFPSNGYCPLKLSKRKGKVYSICHDSCIFWKDNITRDISLQNPFSDSFEFVRVSARHSSCPRDCGPRGEFKITSYFFVKHYNTFYLQLGKGGLLPPGGLSHINGLAGFGPGVLSPAGLLFS